MIALAKALEYSTWLRLQIFVQSSSCFITPYLCIYSLWICINGWLQI